MTRKYLFIAVGIAAFLALSAWLLATVVGVFADWTNDNGGFVSAIGLFLVIPFAIWLSRFLENRRRRKQASAILVLLVYKLWHNLNYVSQIEISYENNFELFEIDGPEGFHVPHYGPRTAVLEKFLDADHLASLNQGRQAKLIEVFVQLSSLKEEFVRWREMLWSSPRMLDEQNLYVAASSTMISFIDPVMRNMLSLWIDVLPEIGHSSSLSEITAATDAINFVYAQERPVLIVYKSSALNATSIELADNTIILCWRHDRDDVSVEVTELGSIAPLHSSWAPDTPESSETV